MRFRRSSERVTEAIGERALRESAGELAARASSRLVVADANRALARRDRCYTLLLAVPVPLAGVWSGFASVSDGSPRAHAATVCTRLGFNVIFGVWEFCWRRMSQLGSLRAAPTGNDA